MAPGVGILMRLTQGHPHSVRTVNIARSERTKYESFRQASFDIVDNIVAVLSREWWVYYYFDEFERKKWWAIRLDGTVVIGGYYDKHDLVEAVSTAYHGETIRVRDDDCSMWQTIYYV